MIGLDELYNRIKFVFNSSGWFSASKGFVKVYLKMISCFSIRLDAYLSQHDTQPQGKYNLHSISDEKYYV